jgi:hypothetical protein
MGLAEARHGAIGAIDPADRRSGAEKQRFE